MAGMRTELHVLAAMCLVFGACSEDDAPAEESEQTEDSKPNRHDDDHEDTDEEPAQVEGPGIHVAAKRAILQTEEFTIEPGEEKYLCYATELGEDLVVDGYSHAAQTIVHHIVFSRALAPEPAGFSECDTLFRQTWDPLFLTGAGSSEFLFPEGVGHRLKSGTQLVVQLHLLNTRDEPVTETVAIEMRRSTAEDPRPLSPYVFGTSSVLLPPKQTTTLETDCEIPEPVEIVAAFPHMHLLGRAMKLEVGQGDEAMQTIYERKPFDFDDQHTELLDLRLSPGDKTRVSCTYDNPHDEPITFGESTRNEMCYLIAFAVGQEGLNGCSIARRRSDAQRNEQ